MIPAIKTEFRKLFTIRSTYIVSGLSLLLISAVAFYFIGIKADDTGSPFGPLSLQQAMLNLMTVVGIFTGIVAILHICHEYRYNTISYSLTITNRRVKVLAAKVITISMYAVAMTLLTILLVSVLTPLGVKLGNATVMPQDFAFWEILWRTIAYMVGGALMGLVFGFLFRNLVFSIAMYFVLPTTIEPILINLLKVNANWLPNTAQNQILAGGSSDGVFTPLASAGVLALYLAIGWVIATVLFIRRDAN